VVFVKLDERSKRDPVEALIQEVKRAGGGCVTGRFRKSGSHSVRLRSSSSRANLDRRVYLTELAPLFSLFSSSFSFKLSTLEANVVFIMFPPAILLLSLVARIAAAPMQPSSSEKGTAGRIKLGASSFSASHPIDTTFHPAKVDFHHWVNAEGGVDVRAPAYRALLEHHEHLASITNNEKEAPHWMKDTKNEYNEKLKTAMAVGDVSVDQFHHQLSDKGKKILFDAVKRLHGPQKKLRALPEGSRRTKRVDKIMSYAPGTLTAEQLQWEIHYRQMSKQNRDLLTLTPAQSEKGKRPLPISKGEKTKGATRENVKDYPDHKAHPVFEGTGLKDVPFDRWKLHPDQSKVYTGAVHYHNLLKLEKARHPSIEARMKEYKKGLASSTDPHGTPMEVAYSKQGPLDRKYYRGVVYPGYSQERKDKDRQNRDKCELLPALCIVLQIISFAC
jgi:hypothetical protein